MQTEVGNPDVTDDDDNEIVDDAEDDDLELDDDTEDTIVFSTSKGSDNVGDVSVEINVEELIAEFETGADNSAARRKEIRRRLEELQERRQTMKDLEDTYSFNPSDDD